MINEIEELGINSRKKERFKKIRHDFEFDSINKSSFLPNVMERVVILHNELADEFEYFKKVRSDYSPEQKLEILIRMKYWNMWNCPKNI